MDKLYANISVYDYYYYFWHTDVLNFLNSVSIFHYDKPQTWIPIETLYFNYEPKPQNILLLSLVSPEGNVTESLKIPLARYNNITLIFRYTNTKSFLRNWCCLKNNSQGPSN